MEAQPHPQTQPSHGRACQVTQDRARVTLQLSMESQTGLGKKGP